MKKLLSTTLLSLFLLTACTGEPVDSTPQNLGKLSAKVLIEEFSDPECPACAVVSPQLFELVKENPELARLQYYHFPLSQHKYAFIAAEAAECAGDQGKFWEYLETIFETQASLSEDHLYNVADTLGLNRDTFDMCLDDHTHKAKILSHMSEGARRRVPGTPGIFVNGQLVRFSNIEQFKAYLESL